MRRRTLMMAAAGLLATPRVRAATTRLVVVELFTSQGCSSCPPADALLTELSNGSPDILPLAFHVTYWDRLGWRDPFALPEATARQRRYAALWRAAEVYTPQLVVGGRIGVIGSDRSAVQQALAAASPAALMVRVQRIGGEAVLDVAAGAGAGSLLLVGYDPRHQTTVGRGENGGRTLTESNIVRAITPAGAWTGVAGQSRHALPAGERVAVLLQAPDGAIIGAAREG